MVSDSKFLQYCYNNHIETLLVNILVKESQDDAVLHAVLKTFIVLHASSVFNDAGILVGGALKKNKGVQNLLDIFEARVSHASITNWELVKIIVQTIFMLSFDNKILEQLRYTNVIALTEKTISRALEDGSQNRLILECLKVCSFYSQDESLWSQMITRSFIKALFMMLALKDKDEKRYPLSILNDILASPTAFKYIKELPYKEGMNKLYTLYPKDQVEAILNKIYEEHKNLQGLPVPADFLNRNPHIKNIQGVVAVGGGRSDKQIFDSHGKAHLIITSLIPFYLGYTRLPDLSADIKPSSSYKQGAAGRAQSKGRLGTTMQGSTKGGIMNIMKPSLKQVVINKQMGLSKYSNFNADQPYLSAGDGKQKAPVNLTHSRIEQLANARQVNNTVDHGVKEEHALVDKYLKGLSRMYFIFLISLFAHTLLLILHQPS